MEVMDEVKLLPCPFCGREHDIYHPLYRCDHTLCGGGHLIACGCKARGPERPSEAEAIAAWNTRPTLVTDEVVEPQSLDVNPATHEPSLKQSRP